MDDLVELSSDTDTYYDDRENLDEELSAILKKYENFGSNNVQDKVTENNLEIDCKDFQQNKNENKTYSPKRREFTNDISSSSSEDESENQNKISSPKDIGYKITMTDIKSKQKSSDADKVRKKIDREEKIKQKNEERSVKLAERLKKREELEKARAEKRVMNEIYNSLKPDEAIKQIKCLLDKRISDEIALGLREIEISVKKMDYYTKLYKVTWERDIQMKLIGLDGKLGMNLEEEKVPILYIIEHDKLLKASRNDEVLELAAGTKSSELVTLVELDSNKPQREEEKIIEQALTELQIVSGWSHRKLKSNDELIELIRQYSKAFALAPSKRLKASNKGEITQPASSDCVRVQNNTGHGLAALYTRQLSQFPLASLETAHTVCKLFPTPKSLINSGESQEVIDNLADSQVRRAVGPLSAPRRLGPQLAKKIHVAFTSRDPDTVLS